MSDNEGTEVQEKSFCVDQAKHGRATCKKCKAKCLPGELRIAKVGPNPYPGGIMKYWHHIDCIFKLFSTQRATTKRIVS